MEVVVPTEVVGLIAGFKPSGGLASHVEIDGQLSPVAICVAKILTPLTIDVEIADLIAQQDDFRPSGNGGRIEQVDDDAAIQADLGMVLVFDDLFLKIIISFDCKKVVIDAGIDIKGDVVGIVLIA